MAEQHNIFRDIVKGTVIFGGSQTFSMLINIVRGKLVAQILGAFGMGISSLLQSAIAPFIQFFSFGLPTSAVRSISLESGQDRAHTVVAFRRILTLLSIAGSIIMVLFASWLSIFTFGFDARAPWFIGLAIALFFTIQTTGESSILQGFRKLRHQAIVSIVAPTLGLVVSIPLFYYYGIDGIAPSMCIISIASWGVARFFTSKLNIASVNQTWSSTFSIGKGMLSLGGAMMLSGFFGTCCIYLLNAYIRSFNIADVGLYQAATSISLQCTSMIFAAMATDYFPHLSSIVNDHTKTSQLVEHEGEIVLLIITPIILMLTLFAPLIVSILLTEEFVKIVPVLRMIAFAFLGRAFCFPQDYVCIAKGDKRWFFFFEGIFINVKTIGLSIIGYAFFGFIGLGYAAIANCAIDIISSVLANYFRYGIKYSNAYMRLFIPSTLIISACLASSIFLSGEKSYIVMSILAVLGTCWSISHLDKRIDIRSLIRNRFKPQTA